MGAHSLVSPRLLIYVFQVEPVTVCIPAKNEESCLGRLIDSVMEQDIGNIAEILICVNGSTDNTLSVAKSLEDRIPFLRVITSNPGKANACNALVTESKYDLLLFVDADIVLFRHALSTAYRCLFSDPELILVSTATARVNESMELGYSFIIRPFVIHGNKYPLQPLAITTRIKLSLFHQMLLLLLYPNNTKKFQFYQPYSQIFSTTQVGLSAIFQKLPQKPIQFL